jgi:hypothetical protein
MQRVASFVYSKAIRLNVVLNVVVFLFSEDYVSINRLIAVRSSLQ